MMVSIYVGSWDKYGDKDYSTDFNFDDLEK